MTIQNCPVCRGRDGLFEVTCPECDGAGYSPEEDKPFAQCHTCYGDGTIETSVCPRCGGVGEVDDDDDEYEEEEEVRTTTGTRRKTNARISSRPSTR